MDRNILFLKKTFKIKIIIKMQIIWIKILNLNLQMLKKIIMKFRALIKKRMKVYKLNKTT